MEKKQHVLNWLSNQNYQIGESSLLNLDDLSIELNMDFTTLRSILKDIALTGLIKVEPMIGKGAVLTKIK